jgi:antitoxin HigA-1
VAALSGVAHWPPLAAGSGGSHQAAVGQRLTWKSLITTEEATMATKRLRPVHPGDILRRDFMEPLKLTAYRVAKDLSVSAPTVNEIVRRRKSVSAEMALRLARYFGTSAQLWLNLQTQYDLEVASQKVGKKIEKTIQPAVLPSAAPADQVA